MARGPTHVAIFELENMRYWNPWFSERVRVRSPRRLSVVTFREEGEKKRLTQQPGNFLLSRGQTDRPSTRFLLYAKSEQEAREMAELFIGYAKSLADIKVRRAEYQLEDYRERITEIENKIPKLQANKRAPEAELAKVKETTYFRNKDDAQRSILEWNNRLSAAEVDIIGIQAKLNMVKELRKKEQEKVEADEMFWFLFRMRMTEEIELAGALARKNAALSYRDRALKFLDFAEKLDSVAGQLEKWQGRLSDYQSKVENIEERLPQLRVDVMPVQVVNNEVTIHPVETETPKLP
jgi:archaellum component FlaC